MQDYKTSLQATIGFYLFNKNVDFSLNKEEIVTVFIPILFFYPYSFFLTLFLQTYPYFLLLLNLMLLYFKPRIELAWVT